MKNENQQLSNLNVYNNFNNCNQYEKPGKIKKKKC